LRFSVLHVTSYLYDQPVFLEPHVIRLKPATDAGQRLCRFEAEVQPRPTGMTEILDLEGNSVLVCWFEDLVSELLIKVVAEVETSRSNPFTYLSFNQAALPYHYSGDLLAAAAPYLATRSDPQIVSFAERVSHQVGGAPDAFLSTLAMEIRQRCRLIVRPEGDPRPAETTLALGEGSCRDLAVVFMEASRSMGFAARFVSGYHAVLGEGEQDLHAWAEVYVDGGGWRGFDPTSGLAVGEDHIAVARASSPAHAAPVTGSFRGSASATLQNTVSIEPASES
jgi:transglutaminase-like putative cysteine protease